MSAPVRRSLMLATVIATAAVAATAAGPKTLTLGPLAHLPGDDAVGLSAEDQEWVRVAPGGPGHLVVWQDLRTVLSGFTNTPYVPLMGNQEDIYAARIDATGQLLDPCPIIVDNRGRNQFRPQAAWNGQSWLVVWTSERPDWYFFEDIVGTRVSASGELLDASPIGIRLESQDPANDRGSNPAVASDGTNWLVVWEDGQWVGGVRYPTLAAVRIAPDGSPLDPQRVTLHQHPVAAFGPRRPQVVWAGGEYLVVWSEAGSNEVRAARFDAGLQPLDPQPFTVTSGYTPRVATDGADFLVVTEHHRAHRVTHDGTVLDPAGIDFHIGWQDSPSDAVWDGLDWTVTFSAGAGPLDDYDLYLVRIGADGTVQSPGVAPIHTAPDHELDPAIGTLGPGEVAVVWAQTAGNSERDLRLASVDVAGVVGPDRDLSVGLPRQSRLRFASAGSVHLAVYQSEGAGQSRVLAQRIDPDGNVLDASPVELTALPAGVRVWPEVAFDGSRFLVVWTREGAVYGQRVSTAGTLVDTAPVTLLTNAAVGAAVAGRNGVFLVSYIRSFSGDQQLLDGFRADGSSLAVLDSPIALGFDYVSGVSVEALGTGWLAVWARRPSHDQSPSWVYATAVSADGVASSPFQVSASGYAESPDVASSGDQALVVWTDDFTFNSANIEGRLVNADGSFGSGEIVVADVDRDLFFPAVAWSGASYLTAWTDYRSVPAIEQLRGDVWAAEVGPDGTVLDPDGIQLTSGPLPEDLPDVVGQGGRSLVGFSRLHGSCAPEVQRIGYRVATGLRPQGLFADDFESADTSAWSSTVQ